MRILTGFSTVASLCIAGVALAQAQGIPERTPVMPEQTNPSAQTSPSTTLPETSPGGQAAGTTMTPDQANSATYPAAADSGSSDPGAVSTPQQPDNSGVSHSTRTPDPNAGASNHQKSSLRSAAADSTGGITPGMDVTGHGGEAVGNVTEVIRGSSGEPAYAVIADQSGQDTAVPIAVARHMVHGNKVVLDVQRLQNAPKVAESQLQSSSGTQWKEKADRYWGKGRAQKDRG